MSLETEGLYNEDEESIMNNACLSYEYAREILNRRFKKGEKAISEIDWIKKVEIRLVGFWEL